MRLSKLEEELLRERFPIQSDYDAAIDRLSDHEPLAYILGEWYFYDQVYKVSPDCLIPRPETEHLVDELIKRSPQNAIIADLCTGSGCITISTLCHRIDITAVSVDISVPALSIAKENAIKNGVEKRITFKQADVLKGNALDNNLYDVIVSNPPYIKSELIDKLQEEVLREPRIALNGGNDGLDFYNVIFTKYRDNVKKGGMIICEIGYDQGEELKNKFGVEIIKDYSGNDRIAILYV